MKPRLFLNQSCFYLIEGRLLLKQLVLKFFVEGLDTYVQRLISK